MNVRPSPDTLAPAASTTRPRPRIALRVREQIRDPLNGKVIALTINTVVSSALGIAYWAVAARLYTSEQVGIGAAMVSTMTFLSNLSQLNLNSALARFLPAAGAHGRRLVAYSYGASCLVALVLGSLFLVIAPRVSHSLDLAAQAPLLFVLFGICVALWGVFTMQDSALTAAGGAVWVPIENAAFGIGKIVLLVLFASALPQVGIFASWNIAVVLALVPVNVLMFRQLLPRLASWRRNAVLPARGDLMRFVAFDYIGFLFMQAGTNALPVVVTARLGAEANAVFYIGWILGTSLELVAYHFGTSLTVESAADESRLAANARQVLRRGSLLFIPSAMLMWLVAPIMLALFGAQYAQSGVSTLRLFAAAAVPKLAVIVFVAASRVQRKVGRIIVVQAATTSLVLALALIGMGQLGVTGVGVAYLVAQTLVACAVAGPLARLVRGRS